MEVTMTKETRTRVNALLLQRIEALVKYLFPNGHKEGRSWRLGSLDINLKTGFWGDWDGSTTSMSRNLINLWMYAMHVDFVTAVEEIPEWLGAPAEDPPAVEVTKPDEPKRKLELPPLVKPSRSELRQLSELRGIPIQGLAIAVIRDFLWTYWCPFEGARAWLITDSSRKCAVARRLDGQPWQAPWAKGAKSKSLKGSWGSWPIGLPESERYAAIGLVEGSPDFLALLSQVSLGEMSPVCLSGASMNIPKSQLPKFSGKPVQIFVHDDEPGRRAAERWSAQLSQVTEVSQYQCRGDLNEMLRSGLRLDFARRATDG
jgi:hypothetical protein